MAETLSSIGTMVGKDIKDLRFKKLDKSEANSNFLRTKIKAITQIVESDVDFKGNLSINKILEDTFEIRNSDTIDIKNATDILLKLKPVHQLINNEKKIGFVSDEAKELEKEIPEVISINDENTKMEYIKLIPLLIAAIQEQQIEIETLKTK